MSVASELTRIKGAKNDLKASINAKTDSEHQITNEKIDDYSNFVDSISSGGGADLSDYFTSSISEGTNSKSGFADMIKNIPNTTIVEGTSLQYAFLNYKGTTIPLIDTSNVELFSNMFLNAINLTTIPLINTSNGLNLSSMFQSCTSLTSIPTINTSSCTNVMNMFNGCTNLTTVPILNTSNLTRLSNMFTDCVSLSDDSLDNILQMCINSNVTSSSRKKLTDLGITSTNYPATRVQVLPHYQDFINAGWIIGY